MTIVCLAAAAWSQHERRGRFLTIDPPGVGTAAGLGTEIPGINEAGAVAGFFTDSRFVTHSFFRRPDGRITVFDAPGAGKKTVPGFSLTPAGVMWGQGTYAYSINRYGVIAGTLVDAGGVYHGFVRWPDGRFTTIDIEDAGAEMAEGTFVGNINDWNEVSGQFYDAQGTAHGFVRAPDGNMTTFDAPGAGTGSGQGTNACCATSLNDRGEVSGWFIDADNVLHGFVRKANGNLIPFEGPGAGTLAGQGTAAWSTAPFGEVTGEIVDENNVLHGYVRDRDGRIRPFDVPNAGTGPYQGTIGEGIAGEGIVVGNYYDSLGVSHGYERARDGKFTFVEAPGASTVAGQGTIPLSNNAQGEMAGAWFDRNGALHGFIWIP